MSGNNASNLAQHPSPKTTISKPTPGHPPGLLWRIDVIVFEKTPIALHALHLGLSDEAAAESYGALCASRRRDFEIAGVQYRAASRIDARMHHEDETGVLAPLWAVVEVVG